MRGFSTASSNFINTHRLSSDKEYLDSLIFIMKSQNDPIKIDVPIVQKDNQNNLFWIMKEKIKIIQAVNNDINI